MRPRIVAPVVKERRDYVAFAPAPQRGRPRERALPYRGDRDGAPRRPGLDHAQDETTTMGERMDLPPKQDVARALLLSGSVFVHLDPRVDGVEVPKWLRRQPQLVLQIGLDMAIPIPDLRVDERGLYGTLSFNRAPFTCLVPWESIFALAGDDGRGMVWPDSMPPEITAEIEREAGKRAPAPMSAEADSSADEDDDRDAPTARGGVVPLRPVRRPAPTTSVSRSSEPPAAPATGGAPSGGDATVTRQGGKSGKSLPPYLRVIK